MLKNNEQLTVTIDGYASDGRGVAHPDGEALFVPGALKGETVRVRVEHAGQSSAFAALLSVEAPSPARTAPDCPHFGACGGCALRHMDYSEELRMKASRVRDALSRVGGADPGEVPILGAENPDGYRNKSVFPVVQTASGPVAGYYRAGTHDVVPITRCALGHEAADLARDAVLGWMRENGVPGYSEGREGEVRHIFVRTDRTGGQAQVCVMVQGSRLRAADRLPEALRRAVPGLSSVVLGFTTRRINTIACERYKTIWGADWIEETLLGLRFRLSPASFFQVNPAQAERLYAKALEFAQLTRGETALDLYCGTGTITLLLARDAGQAVGAEIVAQAVRDAEENAERNGVKNARFLCADAGKAAQTLAREGLRPDLVTVDPPRKGLAPDVVETIAAMSPPRVVYVSCDPATLARDVARFAARGYALTKTCAVDMFPRCAHVETVVRLERI